MKPVGIEDLKEQNVSISRLYSTNNILDIVSDQQILRILDEHIPAQHRPTYLKIKYGDKVYKNDLNKLVECIKNILKEHGYEF